jgi:hypothetical protein
VASLAAGQLEPRARRLHGCFCSYLLFLLAGHRVSSSSHQAQSASSHQPFIQKLRSRRKDSSW